MGLKQIVEGDLPWQEVDRGLRASAKHRWSLDADEAALLCMAVRCEIWRNFGEPSLQSYLEKILGYTPRVARLRVRVANAMEEMPALAVALRAGDLTYSAVRELIRVVTPETHLAWIKAVEKRTQREIEDLVTTHRMGDQPDDVPDPTARPVRLFLEVSAATAARYYQARQVLAEEHGFLEDDAIIEMMSEAVLEGPANDNQDHGRAKYQVMVTICEQCERGSQEAAGRSVVVDAADVARAECDAQWIHPDMTATQDVAPKVRRFIFRREKNRCAVPGCRSARFLELHHVVERHLGGSHRAENLTVLCDGHHKALHDNKLTITGIAPKLTFTTHVGRGSTSSPASTISTHVVDHEEDDGRDQAPAPVTGAPTSEEGSAGSKSMVEDDREDERSAQLASDPTFVTHVGRGQTTSALAGWPPDAVQIVMGMPTPEQTAVSQRRLLKILAELAREPDVQRIRDPRGLADPSRERAPHIDEDAATGAVDAPGVTEPPTGS